MGRPWSRHRFPGEAVRRPPTAASRALAAGMGKLNTERCGTRTPAEADNGGQRRLVCIGIETETALCDAARGLDRRLLDNDKPSP